MPRNAAAAAQGPISFRFLLDEDADPHPMLADDSKVTVALKELGADLSHVRGKLKAGDRAEILAGYFWVSAHDSDFESHISRAPDAPCRLLARALGLDFNELSMAPEWPSILFRRAYVWPKATYPSSKKHLLGVLVGSRSRDTRLSSRSRR
jgi:hypothetical protein